MLEIRLHQLENVTPDAKRAKMEHGISIRMSINGTMIERIDSNTLHTYNISHILKEKNVLINSKSNERTFMENATKINDIVSTLKNEEAEDVILDYRITVTKI